jgi:hypothetical protein
MNALNILQVHYMDIALYEIRAASEAGELCLLFCHGLYSNVITFNKNRYQASSDLTGIAFLIIATIFFFCSPTCSGPWEHRLVHFYHTSLYSIYKSCSLLGPYLPNIFRRSYACAVRTSGLRNANFRSTSWNFTEDYCLAITTPIYDQIKFQIVFWYQIFPMNCLQR